MRLSLRPIALAGLVILTASSCADSNLPLSPTEAEFAKGGNPSGYTAIDLGSLGGGGTEAVVINNRGWVAGSSLTSDGRREGFLWTSKNGMQSIHPVFLDFSRAVDMNESGQVVLNTDAHHIFLWTPEDGARMIESDGSAYGINNTGDVIALIDRATLILYPDGQGTYYSPHVFRADSWREGGRAWEAVTDDSYRGVETAYFESWSWGMFHINNDGEVLGHAAPYVWFSDDPADPVIQLVGPPQLAVWTPDGGFDFTRTLEIPDRTVNARGDYVSGQYLYSKNPGRYGVRKN
jgi:uncharacterized membrane protein